MKPAPEAVAPRRPASLWRTWRAVASELGATAGDDETWGRPLIRATGAIEAHDLVSVTTSSRPETPGRHSEPEPQHFLYFRPLPHGHGALRRTLVARLEGIEGLAASSASTISIIRSSGNPSPSKVALPRRARRCGRLRPAGGSSVGRYAGAGSADSLGLSGERLGLLVTPGLSIQQHEPVGDVLPVPGAGRRVAAAE